MNNTAKIEALLFVAGEEGLTLFDLSSLSGLSGPACQQQIERLREKYQADELSGLSLIETAGLFRLSTKAEAAELLSVYAKSNLNQRLSRSALEVLSIVAYKQPITRIQIDQLRGVSSAGSLSTLRAFDLVKKVGVLEAVGHPGLYGTTEFFLDYIGINALEDLPEPPAEDSDQAQENLLFGENDNEDQ